MKERQLKKNGQEVAVNPAIEKMEKWGLIGRQLGDSFKNWRNMWIGI